LVALVVTDPSSTSVRSVDGGGGGGRGRGEVVLLLDEVLRVLVMVMLVGWW